MSHGKILCLHGYTQSGPLFAAKTAGLRKTLLKQGFETHFLTAPLKLTPADLPFDPKPFDAADPKKEAPDYRTWWIATGEYEINEAWATVRECVSAEGPFVGIMGFSQGAAFAAVVAAQLTVMTTQTEPPKFAILYSGFRLKPKNLQKYYEPPIAVPTLHVWGELDTVVEEKRSTELWEACDETTRTVLKHPGGHFVPNSKAVVTLVVSWVLNIVAPVALAPVKEAAPSGDAFADDLLASINDLGKL